MKLRSLRLAALAAALAVAGGCGKPSEPSLRDAFAEQLAANSFVKDFQRTGDELRFSGPGAEGGTAKWRVHIDSTVVEPNEDPKNSAAQPYRGVVKSSWFSDDQPIRPSGGESNLPFELLSNGVSQDCWAFWDAASERWTW